MERLSSLIMRFCEIGSDRIKKGAESAPFFIQEMIKNSIYLEVFSAASIMFERPCRDRAFFAGFPFT